MNKNNLLDSKTIPVHTENNDTDEYARISITDSDRVLAHLASPWISTRTIDACKKNILKSGGIRLIDKVYLEGIKEMVAFDYLTLHLTPRPTGYRYSSLWNEAELGRELDADDIWTIHKDDNGARPNQWVIGGRKSVVDAWWSSAVSSDVCGELFAHPEHNDMPHHDKIAYVLLFLYPQVLRARSWWCVSDNSNCYALNNHHSGIEDWITARDYKWFPGYTPVFEDSNVVPDKDWQDYVDIVQMMRRGEASGEVTN